MNEHTNNSAATEVSISEWGPVKCILFRFAFCYLSIYNLDGIMQLLWLSAVGKWLSDFYHFLIPYVGKNLLHLPTEITIFTNGSGDTTYDYVLVLCYFVLSILVTIIWSVLDRKRKSYLRLYAWLRMAVRIVLAVTMITYGVVKVIQMQFPPLSLARLTQPLGEFSPMGLCWTFMGYSAGYNLFTGSAEMLGGILLFIPQCALAGALVSGAVMTNVFMLNMCFDVPVKLYSFHLLLFSLFIALPDIMRLCKFFFLGKPSSEVFVAPLFKNGKRDQLATLLQILFGVYFVSTSLWSTYASYDKMKKELADFPAGIWKVESLTLDGESKLQDKKMQWKTLTFADGYLCKIEASDGERYSFRIYYDSKTKEIKISEFSGMKKGKEGKQVAELHFSVNSPTEAELLGVFTGKKLICKLKPIDPKQFPLVNRGFNWINEYPVNR